MDVFKVEMLMSFYLFMFLTKEQGSQNQNFHSGFRGRMEDCYFPELSVGLMPVCITK